MMVEDTGARPKLFNAGPSRGDTPARLARDYNCPQFRTRKIKLLLSGFFGQVYGISTSAAENGRFQVQDLIDTGDAAQTASRNAKATEACGRFEREPKADERAKRKG